MSNDARLSSLAAFAQELVLPMGLTLDEVEVQTGPATFADDKFTLGEPGKVIVSIGPESLAAFVSTQLPPLIRNLRIEFNDGLIRATASAKLVVEVTVTAILRPKIIGQEEMHLDVVDFEGPSVARGIMEKQLESQNPVFKTSDVPFPFSLEAVEVGDFLSITGTWNLPPA